MWPGISFIALAQARMNCALIVRLSQFQYWSEVEISNSKMQHFVSLGFLPIETSAQRLVIPVKDQINFSSGSIFSQFFNFTAGEDFVFSNKVTHRIISFF